MKKCPTCEKTFDDSMRFCQTDGTPLVNVVEEAPEDPYKTIVAPKDEIAASIPPDDPFKTMVGGSMAKPETSDLLQLPEEFDPMKTSVVSPDELREQLAANSAQRDSTSAAPPIDSSSPLELDDLNVSSSAPPELPRFSEPILDPPEPGSMSSGRSSDSTPQNEPFSYGSEPPPPELSPSGWTPVSNETPASQNPFDSSPFDRQDSAIPSPFGDAPKSFDTPSAPPYKEPEPPPTMMGGNPFDQPVSLGKQESQSPNQSLNPSSARNDWAPPPAPVSEWQNQNIGQNTPFQPPAAGAGAGAGASQTLALASLICGVLAFIGLAGLFVPFVSFVCFGLVPLLGLAAIITGVLAFLRIKNKPEQYTGKGLAIGGIVTGVLSFLGLLGYIVMLVLLIGGQFR